MAFNFKRDADGTGVFETDRGSVTTPIFMPVGTAASVKALDAADIRAAGAEIILANTYHLFLRPGEELVSSLGGVSEFMKWDGPVLTDSGGFQVFSLGLGASGEKLSKIDEDGVEFKSHLDGKSYKFTPERSIDIQMKLGADVAMAFDECTPDQATHEYAKQALDRTHRWAERCVRQWEKNSRKSAQGKYQALFGIIQGSTFQDLRIEAAKYISSLPFDGIALGGETIGYNMESTLEVVEWVRELLPKNKPIYAMGLGRDPKNVVDIIKAGVDMFDCVAPTRLARNGALYHGHIVGDNFESEFPKGRLNIGNLAFARDSKPIMEGCDCYTCASGYTRAYLRHLYLAKELSYYRLSSIHNVRFMVRLSKEARGLLK